MICIVDECFVRLFADDTGLTCDDKIFNVLVNKAWVKIAILFEWCLFNKLTVNSDKTHSIRNKYLLDLNV